MCFGLMEEKWDIAIILDACRYDTFKKLYRRYLPKGKLEKKLGAKDTYHWLIKNFSNSFHKKVIYVSGHPAINSYGIPWKNFKATEHFFKIYDVWNDGWDEKLSTTRPENVVKTALKVIKRRGSRRVLIHFVQPHTPYRMEPIRDKTVSHKTVIYKDYWNGKEKPINIKFKSLRRIIGKPINKIGENVGVVCHFFRNLRKFLNIPLNSIDEWYWRNFSRQELIEMYEDNLKWVLENVEKFLNKISDNNMKIIITADHGEALGEYGFWFHLNNSPYVRTVPYFIIS